MGKLLGTLIVIILKAKNLPNKQRIGKQDAFATLVYRGQRNKTQVVKKAGQHPIFDEEFRYEVREDVDNEVHAEVTASGGVRPAAEGRKPPKGRLIKLTVYSDDPRDPGFIGEVMIDFEKTMTDGEYDEWVTLLDAQKKYAGEVFVEMTYYDHSRKPMQPRRPPQNGPYGAQNEFEPPLTPTSGPSSMMRGNVRAQHLASCSTSTPPRTSSSYQQLTSAGIEPYAPIYAPPGLVPPRPVSGGGRDTPPQQPPNRHHSLNDTDIAALSTSLSTMGVRKPLPLPGSASRHSMNPGSLPASFHVNRATLPESDPPRSQSSAYNQVFSPPIAHGSTTMYASHSAPPDPNYSQFGVPGASSPAGIEGWRRRVHSESRALEEPPATPRSAPLPSSRGFLTPPPSMGRPLPSPSPQKLTPQQRGWPVASSAEMPSEHSMTVTQGPAPRHVPAAPAHPPMAGFPQSGPPGPHGPLLASPTHIQRLTSPQRGPSLASPSLPSPQRYVSANSYQPDSPQLYAPHVSKQHYTAGSPPSNATRLPGPPPGYVPGPPPMPFPQVTVDTLPRPPPQDATSLPYAAASQPTWGQSPPSPPTAYDAQAYQQNTYSAGPQGGHRLPGDYYSPTALSDEGPRMQMFPNGMQPAQREGQASRPLPSTNAHSSQTIYEPSPAPPEALRPTAANDRRTLPTQPQTANHSVQQQQHSPARPSRSMQPLVHSSVLPHSPGDTALEPPPRHTSYTGAGPIASQKLGAPDALVRPLPTRPPEQQSPAPVAAHQPPQYYIYEPPSRR